MGSQSSPGFVNWLGRTHSNLSGSIHVSRHHLLMLRLLTCDVLSGCIDKSSSAELQEGQSRVRSRQLNYTDLKQR